MNLQQSRRLLQESLLCCLRLAFMMELSQGRPLPRKFQDRLKRETREELRSLETMLEALQDDVDP
jgi:hypothetical protein